MIARLGVSIHSDGVRAVLVRGGEVRWHASVACDFGAAGGEAIASLLSTMPKGVGIRRATVAVGPAWCQVKQIEGLPAVHDLSVATQLLRENTASFFLRGTRRLAVSDVARFADGALWAAAFDNDIALAAIASLEKRGFTRVRVMPSVAATAWLLPSGAHRWSDGDYTMELTVADGALTHVRRVVADGETPLPPLSGPLSALGVEAGAYVAAFGAAIAPRRTRFEWRPEPDPARVARATRVRIAAAAILSLAAAGAAVAAPGIRAARIVDRASSEMNALRAAQTEVARTQGELRRVAASLERIERFREQRGKTALLLGAISQALPESTALVTLRLDTLEGNFVALTPHAADILPQLAAVTELVSPRIVGSLTKEMMGATQLERATVRFKRLVPQSKTAPVRGGKT